jgi:hypothetical protein
MNMDGLNDFLKALRRWAYATTVIETHKMPIEFMSDVFDYGFEFHEAGIFWDMYYATP